jgi:hypothetical protein
VASAAALGWSADLVWVEQPPDATST